MNCQICNSSAATVHVTEIHEFCREGGAHKLSQKHLCEGCAGLLNLPHQPLIQKSVVDIWKLLQHSAQQSRRTAEACPGCGMTTREFRSRGRLGCPSCYEAFRRHLDPLLQRMHNSLRHVGRVPGRSEDEQGRLQHLHELQERLESAIREEDYEDAAKLRDEIQVLEQTGGGDS